jgi:hypothetical protein
MLKQLFTGLVFVAVLFALFSCTDHDTAIYYFIEHESELAKDAFSDERTINGMASTNNDANYYLVCGTSMWTRAAVGGTWNKVTPPSSGICQSIASFTPAGTERLYVGMTDGLWYTENLSGNTSPTWNPTSGIGNLQILRLKVVNNILLVSTTDVQQHSLYYYNAGPFALSASFQNISDTIKDFDYDGTNYLIVTNNAFYKGTSITLAMTADATVPALVTISESLKEELRGIIRTDAGHYYLSTTHGRIFYSANGSGAWSPIDDSDGDNIIKSANNKEVPFRHLKQIPVGGRILAGAYGYGYYSWVDGATTITRITNFTVQQVYTGVCDDFFIDTTNNLVFLLTHGSGLWKNGYSAGNLTDDIWEQE